MLFFRNVTNPVNLTLAKTHVLSNVLRKDILGVCIKHAIMDNTIFEL